MGLQGEAKIKVSVPKHDNLEDLWNDIEAAVRKAGPTLELGPINADTLKLLENLINGKIDQKVFVKGLTAIASRLRKNAPKALEKALCGALSEVFPRIGRSRPSRAVCCRSSTRTPSPSRGPVRRQAPDRALRRGHVHARARQRLRAERHLLAQA